MPEAVPVSCVNTETYPADLDQHDTKLLQRVTRQRFYKAKTQRRPSGVDWKLGRVMSTDGSLPNR
jgi:hypothetical protein